MRHISLTSRHISIFLRHISLTPRDLRNVQAYHLLMNSLDHYYNFGILIAVSNYILFFIVMIKVWESQKRICININHSYHQCLLVSTDLNRVHKVQGTTIGYFYHDNVCIMTNCSQKLHNIIFCDDKSARKPKKDMHQH